MGCFFVGMERKFVLLRQRYENNPVWWYIITAIKWSVPCLHYNCWGHFFLISRFRNPPERKKCADDFKIWCGALFFIFARFSSNTFFSYFVGQLCCLQKMWKFLCIFMLCMVTQPRLFLNKACDHIPGAPFYPGCMLFHNVCPYRCIALRTDAWFLYTIFPQLDTWASISRLCVACLTSTGAEASIGILNFQGV